MVVNCPSCKEQIEIPRGTAPPPAPKLSIPTMPVKRGINARALLIIGGIIFFVFVLMFATQHENSPSTPVKAQVGLTASAVAVTNLDEQTWPRVTVYLNGTPLDGYKAVYTSEVAPHEPILIPFSEFVRGDRRFNPLERKVIQAMVWVEGHDAPMFSFR